MSCRGAIGHQYLVMKAKLAQPVNRFRGNVFDVVPVSIKLFLGAFIDDVRRHHSVTWTEIRRFPRSAFPIYKAHLYIMHVLF